MDKWHRTRRTVTIITWWHILNCSSQFVQTTSNHHLIARENSQNPDPIIKLASIILWSSVLFYCNNVASLFSSQVRTMQVSKFYTLVELPHEPNVTTCKAYANCQTLECFIAEQFYYLTDQHKIFISCRYRSLQSLCSNDRSRVIGVWNV